MCGIAGKVSFSSNFVTESQINRMTKAIIHRGPDDGGTYISSDHKVGLGNRRLAIIDLSPLGHMPMSYKNRYWITYNGEVYNFQPERKKLQKLGYRFKSQSDTEVILALYDKYGVKCLDHLRGMFAFAIHDTHTNTLFCARDRIGKKPLKYYHDGKVFIFASELKAILTQPEYQKQPDFLSIHHYLTLQYCPSPLTGFTGINKLEPGSYLLLDISKNKLEKTRYWKLDFSKKLDLSEDDWCDRIRTKLEESVKLRLISDVPLGAFLSGGTDSSAVVAMMAKLSNQPVKTFSIGFNEKRHSELPFAKIVADHFKTDHTEFIVKPETIEILPSLVKQYEEPYADSSSLATFYVSQLTRKYVTVALNGDGGDENFAGYPWYPIHKFSLMYERFSLFNSALARPFWSYLNSTFPSTLTERGLRFANIISKSYPDRYLDYIAYFTSEMKDQLYKPDLKNQFSGIDTNDLLASKFLESNTPDRLDQAFYTDITTYLPDDLQVKVDIATMANSLEGRSPFLDHEFMELAAKIPSALKLKNGVTKKYILKKALTHLLPQKILNRPKMGFGVPIESWFKTDLQSYLKKVLLSKNSHLREFLNQDYINQLIKMHQNTKINLSLRLWSLLTLELWFQSYFP